MPGGGHVRGQPDALDRSAQRDVFDDVIETIVPPGLSRTNRRRGEDPGNHAPREHRLHGGWAAGCSAGARAPRLAGSESGAAGERWTGERGPDRSRRPSARKSGAWPVARSARQPSASAMTTTNTCFQKWPGPVSGNYYFVETPFNCRHFPDRAEGIDGDRRPSCRIRFGLDGWCRRMANALTELERGPSASSCCRTWSATCRSRYGPPRGRPEPGGRKSADSSSPGNRPTRLHLAAEQSKSAFSLMPSTRGTGSK